jgi:hypothetical protein
MGVSVSRIRPSKSKTSARIIGTTIAQELVIAQNKIIRVVALAGGLSTVCCPT